MSPNKREVVYPRLALLCLVLVVVLTLFLFGVGLVTLKEKQAEVMGLELSNVKLRTEQVAAEVNRQTWQQAEAVLADTGFQKLLSLASQTPSAAQEREARKILAEIVARHPVVKQVIVVADGRFVTLEQVGRGFRQGLEKRLAAADVGQTGTDPIWLGSRQYQVFFKIFDRRNRAAAFIVDEQWVSDVLLHRIALSLGFDPVAAQHIRLKQGASEPFNDGFALDTQLTGVLPFMHIEIAESPILRQKASAVRETVYLVVSCLMFLSILVAGLVLIIRLVRDLHVKQMRTDFMSAFSHELKTPLTLIRLYAETLQNDDEISPATRESYCQIISRESERLSRLLERLLTARKIEQGRNQYTLVTGNLAETVARTVESYSEHLRLRGFTVDLDLAVSLPPLRFDSEAVSQAILNLMDNARKYSGDARYIAVRLFRERSDCILEVEDHGVGIPPEEQPRIFEGFYRVSNSPSRQGFGLGLFLVQHVMKAHNGRVEVFSETARGSRFRLVFPMSRPARLAGLARNFHPFARTMQLARYVGGR